MKLTIKWRYPDEMENHTHTFYDINPQTVGIHFGMLSFCGYENPNDNHWSFQLTHIVDMKMEEE